MRRDQVRLLRFTRPATAKWQLVAPGAPSVRLLPIERGTRVAVRLAVGTCSWTDPTLVRDTEFYPEGVDSAEERLRYYASIFPLVEVDSTFYGPPVERVVKAWTE